MSVLFSVLCKKVLVIVVFFFLFFVEFENVIKKTTFFNKIIFDFDTEFVKTYFGKEKKAHVRFDDFSHLLQVCSIFIIPTVSSIVI